MNPFPVVIAALRRRVWTALALVALVALAVALAVAVGVTERGVRKGAARAANGFDLVVGAPGSPTQLVLAAVYLRAEAIPLLPGATLQALTADPRAARVSPIGFGDSWRGHPVIGVTADFVTRGGTAAPAEGRVFAGMWEAVAGARVKLTAGATLSPSHGPGQPEDAGEDHDDHDHPQGDHDDDHGHAHADGAHAETRYTVVGRLNPTGTPWDNAILVPIESVWELHGLGSGHGADDTRIGPPWTDPPGVPAVVVHPRGVAEAYQLRQQYRTATSLALFPAEVLAPLLRALGDVRGMLSVMAGATVALVLAAVFLALSALLFARRREFAVLRAIGAAPRYVLATVWTEMAAIVAAGAAIGLPVGWAAAALMLRQAGSELSVTLAATPEWGDALVPALALAAGLVAGLLPAIAAWRRPVESDLRS